ncbi:hypothetical protein, partial [Nocardia altamirensis]|uniref:hypothetical protein n=1 Tax=Nocardia altamirensis TaxID=472158 RepID=UPI001C3F56BE
PKQQEPAPDSVSATELSSSLGGAHAPPQALLIPCAQFGSNTDKRWPRTELAHGWGESAG